MNGIVAALSAPIPIGAGYLASLLFFVATGFYHAGKSRANRALLVEYTRVRHVAGRRERRRNDQAKHRELARAFSQALEEDSARNRARALRRVN